MSSMPAPASASLRELFGGAIVANIPNGFKDLSEVREVPDNQEVFGNANSDHSVIVELLEQVEETSGEGAARWHFMEIASSNGSTRQEIVAQRQLNTGECPFLNSSPGVVGTIAIGYQDIAKGSSPSTRVAVYVAVLRLPAQTTDIVITINDPTPESTTMGALHNVEPLFMSLLSTFQIRDWGLFP